MPQKVRQRRRRSGNVRAGVRGLGPTNAASSPQTRPRAHKRGLEPINAASGPSTRPRAHNHIDPDTLITESITGPRQTHTTRRYVTRRRAGEHQGTEGIAGPRQTRTTRRYVVGRRAREHQWEQDDFDNSGVRSHEKATVHHEASPHDIDHFKRHSEYVLHNWHHTTSRHPFKR